MESSPRTIDILDNIFFSRGAPTDDDELTAITYDPVTNTLSIRQVFFISGFISRNGGGGPFGNGNWNFVPGDAQMMTYGCGADATCFSPARFFQSPHF